MADVSGYALDRAQQIWNDMKDEPDSTGKIAVLAEALEASEQSVAAEPEQRDEVQAAQIVGSLSDSTLQDVLRADIARALAQARQSAFRMGYAEAAGKQGKVRVLRVIEYVYPDAQTMVRDMANWGVQGLGKFGQVTLNSVVLAPEVVE
jgi:hypothetical protein